MSAEKTCPTCNGRGRVRSRIGNHPYCPDCEGRGTVPEDES